MEGCKKWALEKRRSMYICYKVNYFFVATMRCNGAENSKPPKDTSKAPIKCTCQISRCLFQFGGEIWWGKSSTSTILIHVCRRLTFWIRHVVQLLIFYRFVQKRLIFCDFCSSALSSLKFGHDWILISTQRHNF